MCLFEGSMTNCPAYLSIVINDRTELEEIFKYDLLISCPPTFRITYKIPNWKLLQEKTFDVMFDDSKKIHRVFLTHLMLPNFNEKCEKLSIETGVSDAAENNVKYLVAGGITLCVGCCIIYIAHLFTELLAKKYSPWHQWSEWKRKIAITNSSALSKFKSGVHWKITNPVQKTVMIVYVIANIMYCIMFTFTTFSILFQVYCSKDLSVITNYNNIYGNFLDKTREKYQGVAKELEEEIKRQSLYVRRSQAACVRYIDDVSIALIDNIQKLKLLLFPANASYGPGYIIHEVVSRYNEFVNTELEEIKKFSLQYRKNADIILRPTYLKYQSYLQRLSDNSWLMYAQTLLNQSHKQFINNRIEDKADSGRSTQFQFAGKHKTLAQFLDLGDADSIFIWQEILLDK